MSKGVDEEATGRGPRTLSVLPLRPQQLEGGPYRAPSQFSHDVGDGISVTQLFRFLCRSRSAVEQCSNRHDGLDSLHPHWSRMFPKGGRALRTGP